MMMIVLIGLVLLCLAAVLPCHAAKASGEEESRIGIISAMEIELNLLLKNAEIDHVDTVGGTDYYVGKLLGRPVVLVQAGMGKTLASAGTATMLNRYKIEKVIFTGVAGGVGDKTRVMDVVIGTRLLHHDFGQLTNDGFVWGMIDPGEKGYYDCDPKLVEKAEQAAVRIVGEDHVFKGVIASGDQFVSSAKYVEYLQKDYNAMACEMEGASVAQVCTKYGKPFVVIRTMSDKADGKAVQSYENFMGDAGNISSRILMEMLGE